ncbi:MAG: hypothetical protein MJ192_03515 [Clostridia bacterium]|nr:hypothetical protein [Clostridia bacterium]
MLAAGPGDGEFLQWRLGGTTVRVRFLFLFSSFLRLLRRVIDLILDVCWHGGTDVMLRTAVRFLFLSFFGLSPPPFLPFLDFSGRFFDLDALYARRYIIITFKTKIF